MPCLSRKRKIRWSLVNRSWHYSIPLPKNANVDYEKSGGASPPLQTVEKNYCGGWCGAPPHAPAGGLSPCTPFIGLRPKTPREPLGAANHSFEKVTVRKSGRYPFSRVPLFRFLFFLGQGQEARVGFWGAAPNGNARQKQGYPTKHLTSWGEAPITGCRGHCPLPGCGAEPHLVPPSPVSALQVK